MPSSQLCVKLASGGDPTYAFNIRFTGEEVHGTSKSGSELLLRGHQVPPCELPPGAIRVFSKTRLLLAVRSSVPLVVVVVVVLQTRLPRVQRDRWFIFMVQLVPMCATLPPGAGKYTNNELFEAWGGRLA